MFGTGTIGGNVTVGKTVNANSATGDAVTDTYTNSAGGTQMDSATLVDSKTTANGTGNSSTAQAFTMNYPCSTLNTAAGSGKPFEGSTVSYSMTKTQMDAMFP